MSAGGVHTSLGRRGEVLVIDWKTAGNLPQPFEQHHEYNVVLFQDRAELRQLKQLELGMTKYVIHTEEFPAPGEVNAGAFLETFQRALTVYSPDVRMAIRWALKGSAVVPTQTVVP